MTVGETSADKATAEKPARRGSSRKWDNETRVGLVRRARRMNRALAQAFPHVYCELDFTNPLELTVATILSAQSTDKMINSVTPKLFARYPTAADYAAADRAELEEMIRPTGFFRNKAKSLVAMARALVERHGGDVPAEMDDLVRLPGVGRKTANVILGNAFGRSVGVVVDTHVGRLSGRLGLSSFDDPVKIEQDLMRLFPQEHWTLLAHLLIDHGRAVCDARAPKCEICFLSDLCPSSRV